MSYITIITGLLADLPVWITAITGLVVAANAITVLTPTKSDDKILNVILKVLNFVSMNFGKNTNKDA